MNHDGKYAYGIINSNSLDSDMVDTLLYRTGQNLSEAEALVDEYLRHISGYGYLTEPPPYPDLSTVSVIEKAKALDSYRWELMDFILQSEIAEPDLTEFSIDEPVTVGTCEGVTYQTTWLGGALLFFILQSPVVQKVRTCSPCVPGAGDLENIIGSPLDVSESLEGDFTVGYMPGATCMAYTVPDSWRFE